MTVRNRYEKHRYETGTKSSGLVPSTVRNGPESLEIPSNSYRTGPDEKRAAVRKSLEATSPGLLRFLDMARNKFPNSKLVGLEIETAPGEWVDGNSLTKPAKQPDGDKP